MPEQVLTRAGGRVRPRHPRLRVPERVRQRGAHAAQRRPDHDGRPVRRDGVRGPRLLPRRASRSPRGAPTCGRPAASRPTATGSRSCSRSACGTRSSPAPPRSSSPGPCTPTTRPGCSRASRAGPRRRSCPGSWRPSTRGRPVVLGLVVARNLGAIGDNHQVIAYGYEQDRATGRTTVLIYDNNTPRKAVTLTSGGGPARLDRVQRPLVARVLPAGLHAPTRRGCSPSKAPDVKDPVSTGDTVKLSHVWTGLTLHSHDLPYTHPGSDGLQQVTCFGGSDDNDRWLLVGTAGTPARHRPARRVGRPAAARVHRPLAPQQRRRPVAALAPAAGQRRPTPPTPPRTGGSRSSTPGPWTAGARVRLVHVADGRRPALPPRVRPAADRRPAGGHRLPRARRQRLVDGARAAADRRQPEPHTSVEPPRDQAADQRAGTSSDRTPR